MIRLRANWVSFRRFKSWEGVVELKIFFKILFLWFLLVPFSTSGFAHELIYLEEENHGRYEGNDRDEILAREMNLDQTSPESLGYKDFESYGRWILNDDYGKVWLPNVDEHWVPFRYGHWIWNPFYGRVWASTEVWGWRPFHYGRWIWLNLEGWAWMPGPPAEVWTPGVVRWFWQSNQVGWAPLAPGEAYIPSPPIRRVWPDYEQRRFSPNPRIVPVRPVPRAVHGRIIQPPTIPQERTNNNPAPGQRRLIR